MRKVLLKWVQGRFDQRLDNPERFLDFHSQTISAAF